MFGLILATLTAALMSTVDTLITAVAAIAVNDIYRPLIRPQAGERELLKVARVTSVAVAVIGILMVPVFMGFETIYEAHGAFTAAVTPPLVVTLMLAVFWRRFTRRAALFTLVGGMAAVVFSLFVPEVIRPFAHGVPMTEAGDGIFAGMSQYKFMRAFYGLAVSFAIGVVTTLVTKPESCERQRGLVWGTLADAIRHYKGSPGSEGDPRRARALPRRAEGREERRGHAELPVVRLSRGLAEALAAKSDDVIYLSDRRWWLGGLRSAHVIIGEVFEEQRPIVELGPETFESVVVDTRHDQPLVVDRLY